jgi:GH24 family phage-related lysozyme (muramidase)
MTFMNRLREFAGSLALKPSAKAKPVADVKRDLTPSPLEKPAPISNKPVVPAPVAEAPTIKAANEAINALPPVTHRKTGKAGIDLMHEFEGLHKLRANGMVQSYLCPAKVWTIGWGSTGKDPFNGGMIGPNTVWTRQQCDLRFEQHLAQFEQAVRDGIGKAPTSQAQFDAMVCLTYNIGAAGFRRSTVLRKHNMGDFDGAARAFLMWVKAGGKTLRGLVRRREAEAALYRSGS